MVKLKSSFEQPANNCASASRKKGRIFRTVLVVALITGLASLFLRAPEPLYGGKRLSRWLADAKSDSGGTVLSQPALVALRHMGTNAFPSLVRLLTANDSSLKRSLVRLDFTGLLTTAETRHERALAAFRSLGPDAKGAIPLLVNLLTNRYAAPDSAVAMTLIGTEALAPLVCGFRELDKTSRLELVDAVGKNYFNYPANIPFLIKCLEDKDADVRLEAALFLGEGRGVGTLSKDVTDVVQALGAALQDKEPRVRAQAALSLTYHGAAARPQVPALLFCLHDPDTMTRAYAAKALKKIAPETNTTAAPAASNLSSHVAFLK